MSRTGKRINYYLIPVGFDVETNAYATLFL